MSILYGKPKEFIITDTTVNKHDYVDEPILDRLIKIVESELTKSTRTAVKRIRHKHCYFSNRKFNEIIENENNHKDKTNSYNLKLKCLNYIHQLENLYVLNLACDDISNKLTNNIVKLIRLVRKLSKHSNDYICNIYSDSCIKIKNDISGVYQNIIVLMEKEGYIDIGENNRTATMMIEDIINLLDKRSKLTPTKIEDLPFYEIIKC